MNTGPRSRVRLAVVLPVLAIVLFPARADEPPPVVKGIKTALQPFVDRHALAGAYSTGMTIDRKRGLITVFMVQHAGFPGDGGKSQAAFRKAAEEHFDGLKK